MFRFVHYMSMRTCTNMYLIFDDIVVSLQLLQCFSGLLPLSRQGASRQSSVQQLHPDLPPV